MYAEEQIYRNLPGGSFFGEYTVASYFKVAI